MTNVVSFPRPGLRRCWPVIRVERGPGGWWAHEMSGGGDSGVVLALAGTQAEAAALAREALHRDYGGRARLEIAEPEGAA